jgi:hypothetical protein
MKKPKSSGKRLKLAERTGRTKVTAQQALDRMQSFSERKEQFVATVRKGKNRNIPA